LILTALSRLDEDSSEDTLNDFNAQRLQRQRLKAADPGNFMHDLFIFGATVPSNCAHQAQVIFDNAKKQLESLGAQVSLDRRTNREVVTEQVEQYEAANNQPLPRKPRIDQ